MQLTRFRVINYRNILDSGWIEVSKITAIVGQNEAGKSNLFEALYRINPFAQEDKYNIDEDWPVDEWGSRDPTTIVCEAHFSLSFDEISQLYQASTIEQPASEDEPIEPNVTTRVEVPRELTVVGSRTYNGGPIFVIKGDSSALFDSTKADLWIRSYAPKFVLIQDYGLSGSQIELDHLANRIESTPWGQLTNDEQTIKIVLDLAKIDIHPFLSKGGTPEGRTIRSFDKRAASAFLSKQFRRLWTQKEVNFDIEIDGTTLNIFARDTAIDMPVRLNRRSSGFRWHVSFAWKFTHASQGIYQGCILLLEEPGIHLHYSGQRDLLDVFEIISTDNTILYTTHLASMMDPAFPERVRIVETKNHHSVVKEGVVSSQRAPMAVIEVALGLTGDMSGLLGTRQTLIVEGVDDALILRKLSGILRKGNKAHLSDRIYLWPAQGAAKTPMYAAFAVGQGWTSGVLLDSDAEGEAARKKLQEMTLKELAKDQHEKFIIVMLGKAAGIEKNDAAIEDLFDDQFYLDCVNAAFGFAIKFDDLPVDGSDMISKRIEVVMKDRFGRQSLDKRQVMKEMLRRFDKWNAVSDLPPDTERRAERLFDTINRAFGNTPD